MLAGREGLIRLIGRRRRFLPNRRHLLSAPFSNTLNLEVDDNGRLVPVDTLEKSGDTAAALEAAKDEGHLLEESPSPDLTCPVCRTKISGGDYMINFHLDACLSRGTKRKLIQTTLLQSRFWSRPEVKAKSLPNETEHSENGFLYTQPDNFSKQGVAFGNSDYKVVETNESKQYGQHHSLKAVEHGDSSGYTRISDSLYCKIDASCSQNNVVLGKRVRAALDDVHGAVLETFIVGRKFSDVKDLDARVNLSLLRDPYNITDPNAIKVVSADSGFSEMLGYLPKEVSLYLSPLIDKYCLKFEVTIASVPENSSEVVPIRVVIQRVASDDQMEQRDAEDFKSLWEKVLQVVEYHRKFPPQMTRHQRNFNILLQEVLRCYSHLFTLDEKGLLESFPSLSEDSQRLFVRLYMRKGPWFRQSNVSYPEVSDSLQALKDLTVGGFMSSVEDANELADREMKEILYLLSLSELREIASVNKKFCHGSRKRDLISSLCSSYADGTSPLLPGMILERTGLCSKISTVAESLMWRAERLFFLNGEQDLSSFILQDLGIVKYPNYECVVSEQIFLDRTELLAYEEAIEVAQIMDESLDENDTRTLLKCIMIADSRICNSSAKPSQSSTPVSLATCTSCFTAPWVYSKVVLLGISFLEHHKRYSQAVYLLRRLLSCFICDGRRGYWTVRLSTDMEHMGCPNESLSVAEQGLQDPWVRAGSRVALQRRILRLAKPPRRWKTPSFSKSIQRKIPEVQIQGRPLNCETGTKNRFYGEDGEQCGVEQLALQYYAGEGGGWQGIHTESGIWLTLFGLLMWDILFSDVPNVFRTRFQSAPLDLETDSFYLSRKNQTEAHLEDIANGMAEEMLIISWENHYGTACRGVVWERFSLDDLRAAVTCVGGRGVAWLCRNLAQDYRSWSSGMPDLLLWRFKGRGYKGEAKLVEVKGPRDRLSEQQRAWLLLLMDCGFDVEICRVRPEPPTAGW